ncbi:MAG: CapA family protein [Lachnospiraceae bacterium]|nr:CapA family protein [Lachnospiraceae bacterium]
MRDEDIKRLLRELAERAEADGQVKSPKVRISFDPEQEPAQDEPLPRESRKREPAQRPTSEKKTSGKETRRRSEKPNTVSEPAVLEEEEAVSLTETDSETELETVQSGQEKRGFALPKLRLPRLSLGRRGEEKNEDGAAFEDEAAFEDAAAFEDEAAFEDAVENADPEEKVLSGEEEAPELSENEADEPEELPEEEAEVEDRSGFAADEADFMDEISDEEAQPPLTLSERIELIRQVLDEKGVGKREWALMGAAGVMILLTLLVLIPMATRKKIRTITTQDGLKIRVEAEPEEWCTSGEVTLGIKAGTPIQSILINNLPIDFEGTDKTQISLTADTENLDVMVVCEDKVMTAVVEVPMIDEVMPVLSIQKEGSLVTLEAVDERSGVAGIWYGEVEAFSDIPAYKPYTEPFTAEADTVYACYCVDAAGNTSTPIVSNLVRASSVTLAQQELTLFPGERRSLDLTMEPALSYVNGLSVTSSDPAVVSVDFDGQVTARGAGQADITVSGDGLVTQTCRVKVITEAQVTISAIGDLTLGDDVNFSPMTSFSTVAAMNDTGYFFNNVRSVLASDDITFGNLEGALSNGGTRKEKQFAFRGSPEYTAILTEGSVEAVTLANNHSADYGDQAYADTQTALEQAGIGWCSGEQISFRDVNGIRVALIGIYALENGTEKLGEVEQTIAAAKAQGAGLIVVGFHWSAEMAETPDDSMVTLAHAAIDQGADMVVGHHPHVLQGIEEYNGKYIAYSLGNFCFGGNSTPSDMDTMIFQVTFELDASKKVTDCRMNIVPCTISSDPYANNYQPTPAQGEEAERILAKIRERSAAFDPQF